MPSKSVRYTLTLTTIVLVSLGVFSFALSPQEANSKHPDSQVNINNDVTLEIVNILDKKHFLDLELNDELSTRFLDNYLERLDPNKAFFYQSDINEFNHYRNQLDDLLKKGDNSIGFVIYERFKQRLDQRLNKVIEILNDESVVFNFNKDETIKNNFDDNEWLISDTEADTYWRKRIKSFLLSEKLSGEELKTSRNKLVKRYKNQLTRIKDTNQDDIYEIYINAFTELYDPHTSYLAPRTAENFNINMSLSLEGIGAVLQTEDDHTKVVRLVTGGPAQKQGGLKASDRIIAVAQGEDGELVDVIGWRLDEVVALIRGPKDSIVQLQVDSSDPTIKGSTVIKIKRDKVKLEDQAAQKAVLTIPGDNDQNYKVGVINIPAFYLDFQAYRNNDPNFRSTTKDVLRLLSELEDEGVDGLIIDLRNNGGGSLQEATTLTDLFINKGPVVQIGKGNNNSTTRSRFNARYKGPLVVMINRLSASASEIFAGAIQDYNRGLIVGSQSFGKGTVQSLSPLESRGDLKITESKFYRVSGDSTQHRGVIPDITFPELLDGEEIGESSYETALVWSKTRPVKFSQYLPIQKMLPSLSNKHALRAKQNPDFLYISEQKSLSDQFKNNDILSLNELIRLKEKNEFENAILALENKRRSSKNLPIFTSYKDFKASNEEKASERAAKAGTTVIDIEDDAMLIEAGHILRDFSEMLANPQAAEIAAIKKSQ